LIEIMRSGDLGTIALVRVRHGNYHLLDLGASATDNWFGQMEQSGGGALLDEGIHAADFLLWLLGAPEQVTALTSNSALGLPLDDTALAIFRYASGTLAEIATGSSLLAAEGSIGIYGTEGGAFLSGVDLASRDFARPPYLKVFRRGSERGQWESSETTPRFRQGKFHHGGPLHFVEVLLGNAEPVVSIEDGWKSVAMIEAAYRASRSGSTQTIDYSLPTL
jgi:predicted dehydrogenase